MGFYASIAPWYDEIFPVDPDTVDFLAARAPRGGSALDLACGTGGYALELARRGLAVEGIDLDDAMVGKAREAAGEGGPRFRALDMRAAPETFAGRGFDLVYCIGNSLVHLSDRREIAALLAGIRPLLRARGALVLQILNYDRILDRDVRELPRIDTPGLSFRRNYVRDGEALRFATELVPAGGEAIRNEVRLLPLRAGELSAALRASGYGEAEWYGDLDGSPLCPEAPCTVAVARA